MDNDKIKIKSILKQITNNKNIRFDSTDDLFALGILDSFGMLSFILKIEKKFKIQIPTNELIPQNFWTIQNTIKTIKKIKSIEK
jgi:acyl carrier protein